MLKSYILVTAAMLLAVFSSACGENDGQMKNEKVEWGYEEENGPAMWGELSEDYKLCAEGKSQSPINLADAKSMQSPSVTFNYSPSPLTIVNNGHTVQVNYEEGSSIMIGETKYDLLQFHFHSPSEHTLSGKSFEMEMHLVHRNASGELAVVGALIRSGSENAAFDPVWEKMPAEKGEPRQIEGVSVNAGDLLPSEKLFYRYEGSLTTPPCSEGVKWFVLTTPIEMSAAQIERFKGIIDFDNNRPVQPLNERELLVDIPADG